MFLYLFTINKHKKRDIRIMKKHCVRCTKFHQSIKSDYCRFCKKALNLYSNEQQKHRARALWKKSCEDIRLYEKEITILAIKRKNKVLNYLDYYITADLYMRVLCNEHAYSTYEPIQQVDFMIEELYNLLHNPFYTGKKEKPGRKKKTKTHHV